MTEKLLNFCPKCGSTELAVKMEPGQLNLFCRNCHMYCEIIIFDEGDD